MRKPFRLWMMGALALVSLGGLVPAVPAAAADDPCAAAVSTTKIGDFAFSEGIVRSTGTWEAGGGAAGALLEFKLDGDRMASETRTGANGTWEFSYNLTGEFKKCGNHTLRVQVFPVVGDAGRLSHCLKKAHSEAKPFNFNCGPSATIGLCHWECSDEEPATCAGSCTASATGGKGDLMAFQGLDNKKYKTVEGPVAGPWSFTVSCTPGQKVTFKVRDTGGIGDFSNVVERVCGEE